jgi:hypothetical protein
MQRFRVLVKTKKEIDHKNLATKIKEFTQVAKDRLGVREQIKASHLSFSDFEWLIEYASEEVDEGAFVVLDLRESLREFIERTVTILGYESGEASVVSSSVGADSFRCLLLVQVNPGMEKEFEVVCHAGMCNEARCTEVLIGPCDYIFEFEVEKVAGACDLEGMRKKELIIRERFEQFIWDTTALAIF